MQKLIKSRTLEQSREPFLDSPGGEPVGEGSEIAHWADSNI